MTDQTQTPPTTFFSGEMGRQSFDGRPAKQPRYLEPPADRNHPPPSQNYNNRLNTIYYKTRLCCKFDQLGCCPYGDSCCYAHGRAELRRMPLRQECAVEQRLSRNVCRNYYNGGECPYGDRCQFVHRRGPTSSAVISIVGGAGSRDGRGGMGSWRNGVCHKWEVFGNCPYGENCHFAHGYGEPRKFGGHGDVSTPNVGSVPSKTVPNSFDEDGPSKGERANENVIGKKWKGPDKISLIYGDWIDESFFNRYPLKNDEV